MESNQYTVFHKIILGLSKLDLELELQQSTANIDQLDSTGMSPLWWAASRGDVEAVRLLLAYGASVTSPFRLTQNGQQPLHVAANEEIIYLLLRHGADIRERDSKGRTPLHVFSFKGPSRGGSLTLLEAVLRQSADPNACTPSGSTPLHYAAMYGLVEYIVLLLQWGADLERRKYVDGYTPLMEAIRHNHADAVKILLEGGADHLTVSSRGETALHLCARGGDCATMEALTDAGLSGLDVDARDGLGMSAADCFVARLGKTPEVELAMETLLTTVRIG